MSASSVIGDITQTLEELLVARQRPQGLFDVSLLSPATESVQPSSKPKINLYLFRVEENQHAKNQDWTAEGPDALRYPPLALNLYYVVTPYAERTLDEHRVLGEAMRVLYDHSIVDPADLKGSLRHTAEELKVDFWEEKFEDVTRIWNAFNQPYRLSVCYEVRIVLIDSAHERVAQRVAEPSQEFGQSG